MTKSGKHGRTLSLAARAVRAKYLRAKARSEKVEKESFEADEAVEEAKVLLKALQAKIYLI